MKGSSVDWTATEAVVGRIQDRIFRAAKIKRPRLEPDDGQSSCPVLRGLGSGNGARLPDFKEDLEAKYRCGGSLKGWQKIPKLAAGNSRFMLALALAFVGPIGDVLRVEQVAIQLFGDPGSGKTAVFIPAGSVWGLHTTSERAINHGFGETWKNTANNLDPIAVAHNHTLLPLEETRTADKAKQPLAEAITDVAM